MLTCACCLVVLKNVKSHTNGDTNGCYRQMHSCKEGVFKAFVSEVFLGLLTGENLFP